MAKKETAEQKLLKMIEASSGGVSSAEKTAAAKKQNLISIVKKINLLLTLLFIFAIVAVVGEMMWGQDFLSKTENIRLDQKMAKSIISDENIVPSIPGLDYYLEQAKKRNIFQPFKEGELVNKSTTASPKNQRLADSTRNLKLVGISWLDTVESASAMIEDVDKKETYFLMRGDKIGDIYVKTIYADSVKLGHDNEEIIIRYDKSQM